MAPGSGIKFTYTKCIRKDLKNRFRYKSVRSDRSIYNTGTGNFPGQDDLAARQRLKAVFLRNTLIREIGKIDLDTQGIPVDRNTYDRFQDHLGF